MGKYSKRLPQLEGGLFLTDGGLETTLIFHRGVDLPHFASFALMRTAEGRDTLKRYFEPYLAAARRHAAGFILDAPTWRANADWGRKLGYTGEQLAAVNRDSVALLEDLREGHEAPGFALVINGVVGPRGDGYDPREVMSADEAQTYHTPQIAALAQSAADMVSAVTMTNVDEAIGIARAARVFDIPVAISFTIETDGRLPTGEGLGAAIEAVDAETGNGPAYYMINCAHPTHMECTFEEPGAWIARLGGLRANASRRSHEELNEAPDLDDGDPVELGAQYRDLLTRFPHIRVVGGCCGTDHRHVACIGEACRELPSAAA